MKILLRTRQVLDIFQAKIELSFQEYVLEWQFTECYIVTNLSFIACVFHTQTLGKCICFETLIVVLNISL